MKEEELQAGTPGTSQLRSGKARESVREGRRREEKWEAVAKKKSKKLLDRNVFSKKMGLIIPAFGNDEVIARRISAKW